MQPAILLSVCQVQVIFISRHANSSWFMRQYFSNEESSPGLNSQLLFVFLNPTAHEAQVDPE